MDMIRYLFRTPPLQTPSLTVNGLGIRELMEARQVDRPAGTGDVLLMFFYDPVMILPPGEPLTAKEKHTAGTMMIWESGQPQWYGSGEREWNHSWIRCEGRFVTRFLRDSGLPVNIPFLLVPASLSAPASLPAQERGFDFDRHLWAIHCELTQSAAPDLTIVRNLLENCIRDLARWAQGKNGGQGRNGVQGGNGARGIAGGQASTPATLLALRAHLEAHYDEPMDLPALAARAHFSVPHLCALFKQHFGRPVMQYLIEVRLHQAACLLTDRALSVKEVARRVGYGDIYHFSKQFKAHYGASPRKYRAAPRTGT